MDFNRNQTVQKIIFVCLGNIIRSPLAEALFCRKVQQAGLADLFIIESAGTGSYYLGEGPDSRMLRVAASRGLLYKHSARKVERSDLDKFDLVIAMDRQNYRDLLSMAQTDQQKYKVHLLREWDVFGGADNSVPDPFYDDIESFLEVYEIIERSVENLFNDLSQKIQKPSA
jgi:protein-tyrosine phosphatase